VRKIAEAVLVLALLLAIGQAKCAGVREGTIREQVKALVAERATSEKRTASLVKRNDSLSATISTLTKAVPQVRTKYVTLRDTLLLQDTGVVPIEVVREVIKAADSLIGIQDRVIQLQRNQILTLTAVVNEKDEQIKSLNREISIVSRQKRPPFLSRLADTGKKAVVGYVVFRGVEAALTR
jgi:Ribonuclease G/E